ncbi:MAG: hypothetical protein WA874_12625 [Chryseosolibacter sp.]
MVLGTPTGGVRKKLSDKAESIRKAGGDITILIVRGIREKVAIESDYRVIEVDHTLSAFVARLPLLWRLSVIMEQRKIYETISHYLQDKNCDIVLMRYPVADFFLHHFMKKFSARFKIVFEHNTLEEEELRLRSTNSFWYRYFLWGESFFGRSVRRAASGMIGVTGEICDRQIQRTGIPCRSVSISNGIDIMRVKLKSRNERPSPGSLNVLFLAGSPAAWHGVDILLNSLKRYSGPTKICCYIAGDIEERLTSVARAMENVVLLNHQANEDLDALVDKCDIGIGSLALFRNQMKEACTLKVREYWARGLPFVVGYDDTDLMHNKSMEPFFLKVMIPPDALEPSFDFEQVVDFARTALQIPDIHEVMRSHAMHQISYGAKGRAYMNFFKSIHS